MRVREDGGGRGGNGAADCDGGEEAGALEGVEEGVVEFCVGG